MEAFKSAGNTTEIIGARQVRRQGRRSYSRNLEGRPAPLLSSLTAVIGEGNNVFLRPRLNADARTERHFRIGPSPGLSPEYEGEEQEGRPLFEGVSWSEPPIASSNGAEAIKAMP